jgi:hypothetical protein
MMVNGSDRVFFEKDGFLQRAQGISMGDGASMVGVNNIARRLGNDISEANPSVIPVARWQSPSLCCSKRLPISTIRFPRDPVFAQDLPGRGSVRLDSGTIDSYYFHVLPG